MMESFQPDEGDERFIEAAAKAAEAADSSTSPSLDPRSSDDVMSLMNPGPIVTSAGSQTHSQQACVRQGGSGATPPVRSPAYFPLKTASAWSMDAAIPAVATPAGELLEAEGVSASARVPAGANRCAIGVGTGAECCESQDGYASHGDAAARDGCDRAIAGVESSAWDSTGGMIPVASSGGGCRRSHATAQSSGPCAMPCVAFGEALNPACRSDSPRPRLSAAGRSIAEKGLVRCREPLQPYRGGRVLSPRCPQEEESEAGAGDAGEKRVGFGGVGGVGGEGMADGVGPWMEVAGGEEPGAACSPRSAEGTALEGGIPAEPQLMGDGLESCATSPAPVAGWLAYAGGVATGSGSEQQQQHQVRGQDAIAAAPIAEPLPEVDMEAEDGLLMFLSEDYFGML